jgi:hypothetical protein
VLIVAQLPGGLRHGEALLVGARPHGQLDNRSVLVHDRRAPLREHDLRDAVGEPDPTDRTEVGSGSVSIYRRVDALEDAHGIVPNPGATRRRVRRYDRPRDVIG